MQAHHVGGEAVYFFLRFVYGGESRHHVGERFVGFFEAFVETFVDAAGDLLQSRVHFFLQGFDAAGKMLGGVAEGVLNEFLVGAALFGQFFQCLREHVAAQDFQTGVQGLHGVARGAQFLIDGGAQAFGFGGGGGEDAVALFAEAVVQVGEHGAVLVFKDAGDARGLAVLQE